MWSHDWFVPAILNLQHTTYYTVYWLKVLNVIVMYLQMSEGNLCVKIIR